MVDFFKFTEQVNLLHPTALLAMKFTAEIPDTETIFLDPVVYQGTPFNEKWEKAIIDVKTHFKREPSSIYIFTSYHPPIVKAPGWQTRTLENQGTNSSEEVFQKRLMDRG